MLTIVLGTIPSDAFYTENVIIAALLILMEMYSPSTQSLTPFFFYNYRYTLGMFKKGYSKTLETEDLYNPLNSDRSQELGDRLEL